MNTNVDDWILNNYFSIIRKFPCNLIEKKSISGKDKVSGKCPQDIRKQTNDYLYNKYFF